MKKILLSLLVVALAALVGCSQPDLPPEPGVPGEQVIVDGGDGSVGAAFSQAYAERGYAPPYDVFANDPSASLLTRLNTTEIILGIDVPEGFLTVTAAHPDGLVYYRGYYFDGNSPVAFDLGAQGEGIYGSNWYDAELSKDLVIPRSAIETGENFIFTYSCEKIDGVWKCGCAAEDACNRWRISDYNATVVDNPVSPGIPQMVPGSGSFVDDSGAVASAASGEDLKLDPLEDSLTMNINLPFDGSFIAPDAYYYNESAQAWVRTEVRAQDQSVEGWKTEGQTMSFIVQRDELADGANYFTYYKCDLVNHVWDCGWYLGTYVVEIVTLPDEPLSPVGAVGTTILYEGSNSMSPLVESMRLSDIRAQCPGVGTGNEAPRVYTQDGGSAPFVDDVLNGGAYYFIVNTQSDCELTHYGVKYTGTPTLQTGRNFVGFGVETPWTQVKDQGCVTAVYYSASSLGYETFYLKPGIGYELDCPNIS